MNRILICIVSLATVLVFFQNCGKSGSSSSAPSASSQAEPVGTLETLPMFGEVYYDLSGYKGLILCFHGRGGSAKGWTSDDNNQFLNDLRALGFSFICPTSLDRTDKQWSNTRTASNVDVLNVDALLDYFQVRQTELLFLVGHSNGGGFNNFYSLLSKRRSSILAVQFSNAAGIATALSSAEYTYYTLFNFADCDTVVDANEVRSNIALLQNKVPPVVVSPNDLDSVYQTGSYDNCHQFVNTSAATFKLFKAAMEAGNWD